MKLLFVFIMAIGLFVGAAFVFDNGVGKKGSCTVTLADYSTIQADNIKMGNTYVVIENSEGRWYYPLSQIESVHFTNK